MRQQIPSRIASAVSRRRHTKSAAQAAAFRVAQELRWCLIMCNIVCSLCTVIVDPTAKVVCKMESESEVGKALYVRLDENNTRYLNNIPEGEEWSDGQMLLAMTKCSGRPSLDCFNFSELHPCPLCECKESSEPVLRLHQLPYAYSMWSSIMMAKFFQDLHDSPCGSRPILDKIQDIVAFHTASKSTEARFGWEIQSAGLDGSWTSKTFSIGRLEHVTVRVKPGGGDSDQLSVCVILPSSDREWLVKGAFSTQGDSGNYDGKEQTSITVVGVQEVCDHRVPLQKGLFELFFRAMVVKPSPQCRPSISDLLNASFTWRVSDLNLVNVPTGHYLQSQKFSVGGIPGMSLRIYPHGFEQQHKCSLFLLAPTGWSIRYRLLVDNAYRELFSTWHFDDQPWGEMSFCDRSDESVRNIRLITVDVLSSVGPGEVHLPTKADLGPCSNPVSGCEGSIASPVTWYEWLWSGIPSFRPVTRVLNIGLGAGNLANTFLQTCSSVDLQSVEYDASAVRVAERWFGLTSHDIELNDALASVRQRQLNLETFDVIVVDCFTHETKNVPLNCRSREFLETVRSLMSPDAVYVQNMFEVNQFFRGYLRDLLEVFGDVDVDYRGSLLPNGHRNFLGQNVVVTARAGETAAQDAGCDAYIGPWKLTVASSDPAAARAFVIKYLGGRSMNVTDTVQGSFTAKGNDGGTCCKVEWVLFPAHHIKSQCGGIELPGNLRYFQLHFVQHQYRPTGRMSIREYEQIIEENLSNFSAYSALMDNRIQMRVDDLDSVVAAFLRDGINFLPRTNQIDSSYSVIFLIPHGAVVELVGPQLTVVSSKQWHRCTQQNHKMIIDWERVEKIEILSAHSAPQTRVTGLSYASSAPAESAKIFAQVTLGAMIDADANACSEQHIVRLHSDVNGPFEVRWTQWFDEVHHVRKVEEYVTTLHGNISLASASNWNHYMDYHSGYIFGDCEAILTRLAAYNMEYFLAPHIVHAAVYFSDSGGNLHSLACIFSQSIKIEELQPFLWCRAPPQSPTIHGFEVTAEMRSSQTRQNEHEIVRNEL
eukprot:TRINITY_DN959_c1_g1_i2.p1 TRINITY_DN959_c1_g1~~TRINITY_DN959_c1_g1_i2.p1  ORF type:complete len:1045 (+),score=51.28 TRINITY_DN959_c1_g1_i2:682-3816(+)